MHHSGMSPNEIVVGSLDAPLGFRYPRPKLFNLRSDPFERAEFEAGDYVKWFIEHVFVLVPAQAIVAQHLKTFQEFPPRQRPGSFSIDQAMEKLVNPQGNK
jgi:arylsulfatase